MRRGCLLLPYHGWDVLKDSMAPIITIFLSYHLVGQPYSLPSCFLLPSFKRGRSVSRLAGMKRPTQNALKKLFVYIKFKRKN